MKTEELIFVNEQLAGMLKTGIPLEGALEQVVRELRKGKYARELEALKNDLTAGIKFEDAVKKRGFPDLYRKMLIVGAKTDKLPQTLNAVADYYRKKGEILMRLTGLLTYPIIVLALSIGILLMIIFYVRPLIYEVFSMSELQELFYYSRRSYRSGYLIGTNIYDWILPGIVIAVFFLLLIIYACPFIRYYFYWKWSPFKDIALSNSASLLFLCLKNGMPLVEAYNFLASLETGFVKRDLHKLIIRLEEGVKHEEAIKETHLFPPFYQWIVNSSGEKLEEGFQAASELYSSRASSRMDLILYAVLPVSIILLGIIVFSQFYSYMNIFIKLLRIFGPMGGY